MHLTPEEKNICGGATMTAFDIWGSDLIILEDMEYESGYSYDYQDDDDPFNNIGDFEFTIVLDRNDKAPAPAKNFTELTELDEDEIDEILEDIGEEIEDIWEDMDYNF